MVRRKMSPEEPAAFQAQLAEWAEDRREFGELIERFGAQLREQKERRERRRRFWRRLLPLSSS
jgi:hypothetical protein